MTLLRLTPLALSRSRFALSPLAETVGSVLALAQPCGDPPDQTGREGDHVTVILTDIDLPRRRLALSRRRCSAFQ